MLHVAKRLDATKAATSGSLRKGSVGLDAVCSTEGVGVRSRYVGERTLNIVQMIQQFRFADSFSWLNDLVSTMSQ